MLLNEWKDAAATEKAAAEKAAAAEEAAAAEKAATAEKVAAAKALVTRPQPVVEPGSGNVPSAVKAGKRKRDERRSMSRYAITFGECAILHVGGTELGAMGSEGFSVDELRLVA